MAPSVPCTQEVQKPVVEEEENAPHSNVGGVRGISRPWLPFVTHRMVDNFSVSVVFGVYAIAICAWMVVLYLAFTETPAPNKTGLVT